MARVLDLQEVPGRGVDKYLSLPTSEYSLLNSKHIAFLGNNTFCITFPLRDSFGLDLDPEVVLQVLPDSEKGCVTFRSTRVSSGRADVDDAAQIGFASIMSREDTDKGNEVYLVGVMQFKVRISLHRAS